MSKRWVLLSALFLYVIPSWPMTNDTGNAPTFLWLDVCTNGIGDKPDQVVIPRMSPDTVDVGVDLDADGTVDRWLSHEKTEYLGRDNQDAVSYSGWRRYLLRLDSDAGKKAKIRIVDKSSTYYIAVKAIRLNYADGTVVPNRVPNGFFDDPTPLKSWKILEGSITDPAKLIHKDTAGKEIFYGSQYYSTFVNGNQDTATIESDVFTLEPPTSFVYGMVQGGGSELWNIKNWGPGTDNASYVYIDVGTETQDPNGKYDDGIDIPLTGFSPLDRDGLITTNMHPVFLNTSGLEGKRAQVVAVDDSSVYAIQLDGFRMNWDNTIIKNGGFEDIPEDWYGDETPREYKTHPSGKIPGWNVTTHKLADGSQPDGNVFYYGPHNSNFSDRVFISTYSIADEAIANERTLRGVEIRSDVFTITRLPDPAKSVFFQYDGAQGTNRIRPEGQSSVELQVDTNGNGQFNDAVDYTYREINQGMGWNINTSNLDLWQYPRYRFYIKPEHYGKQAQIYVEDGLTANYAWMCVDDFVFWNGQSIVQPFPNADFENGDLTNWTEDPQRGLSTWLGGTPEIVASDSKTANIAMNGRPSIADPNYCGDSGEGDDKTGTLISIPFKIPTLIAPVDDWSILR